MVELWTYILDGVATLRFGLDRLAYNLSLQAQSVRLRSSLDDIHLQHFLTARVRVRECGRLSMPVVSHPKYARFVFG